MVAVGSTLDRESEFPMKPPKYTSLPTRFWDKVDKSSNGCWLWTAANGAGRWGSGIGRTGYGTFKIQGKPKRVHRLSACDYYGDLPKGMSVLHKCDTPLCVNPSHLYLGTHADNMRDMAIRHRARGGALPGERNGSAKLTERIVLEARQLYATGKYSQSELARRYGLVSQQTLQKAIVGKTWTHVKGGI